MDNLLSVIIPVYNVEHYLERCIDSITNQTYKRLEIILINDGSTDNSRAICLNYSKEDNRIILIDQENGGSSLARNKGLDVATGDVIAFIDSDDYIELEMFEKMLYLLDKHNLDVIEIAPNNLGMEQTYDDSFTIEDTITATQRIIKKTYFSVWRRIYRKELIKNMRFIPKIIHQDVFFTIDVLNKVSHVGHLNSPLYTYNTEGTSVIRSKYSEHKRDIAIKATEYIVSNTSKHPLVQKVVKDYVVNYYTDHYYLICRNYQFDFEKKFRTKLKKEIFKATSLNNLHLRTLAVLIFPIKFMEFITTKYQKNKKKSV